MRRAVSACWETVSKSVKPDHLGEGETNFAFPQAMAPENSFTKPEDLRVRESKLHGCAMVCISEIRPSAMRELKIPSSPDHQADDMVTYQMLYNC